MYITDPPPYHAHTYIQHNSDDGSIDASLDGSGGGAGGLNTITSAALARPETVVNADGARGTPTVVARRRPEEGMEGEEEWLVGVRGVGWVRGCGYGCL